MRRRVLDLTIAGALTLCAGLLLLASAKGEGSRNAVDRTVLRIASPLERAVSWVVGGIGDIGNRYVWLRDIDSENRELRGENERLRLEIGELRRHLADTDALEAMLDFKEQVPARTIGARIVAGSLSPHFRLIRVRVDRGDGEVTTGMPVVTGAGLVGRVEDVVGGTCEVLLISDPRSSVDVTLPRTGGRGVLTGLGASDRYAARIEQLDRGEEIAIGDPVVTSGLGAAFPAGVEVGVVSAVSPDPGSLYQQVEVTPAVDLARLERVMILLTVPPAFEEAAPAKTDAASIDAPLAGRSGGN